MDKALSELMTCDLVLVILGFRSGSLVPKKPGLTYTSAEFDAAQAEGKPILAFVRKNWVNKETSSSKKLALNRLKKKIDSSPGGPTRTTFTSVDNLALRVIEALADWEDKGRPGARKTFASISDYFKAKSPSAPIQLLDFNTTLLGRENEVQALREFAASETQRAFILSGRGGIGKSKILHDWANLDNS